MRDFYLEKRIRNGVFEFTETDGAVTFGGMEMKLKRSYSSGELRGGEFGYGWTWSFSATGGEVDDERETMLDVVGNMVSVRCGGSRDVTLTLPDGRRCTYRFSLDEGGGWSFAYYANWTAPSGVKASLRPTVSNKLMVLPGMSPYWEATGTECDWELFDFPGFVLTDVDGTEYEYAREPIGEASLVGEDGGASLLDCYGDLKLSCIRKRNGESWQLNEQNILHIKADGDSEEILQMERDEAGRITKLSQKNGHDILYEVYGEYDELPSEYMAQIAVEIVRNKKIVCQLIVPQMDAKTVTLTWTRTRDGAALLLEKGKQYSGIKAFPNLYSGEKHVTGQGPFVFGEMMTVHFQRRLGGMLLEEVTDLLNACENVSYGISMGHGECELTVDELARGERCAAWLRSRHDSVRWQVMGLWGRHEEAGLCVSKIVEGVLVSGDDCIADRYIHGAGELGENRLIENKLDDGWHWVMKAAMNDVSSVFLETLSSGGVAESPWEHVVDLVAMGKAVYAEKGSELSMEMEVFGEEEVVIWRDDCWAGCNSGIRKLDGETIAWQMAVIEHDGNELFPNMKLPQSDSLEDDVTMHVLRMLRALDGDDGWLTQRLTGRLTALALFSKLSELRAACPRIESFSLENDYFRHGTAVLELKGSIGESWIIQVVDSKGKAIRSYTGDGCNGNILWDGRNEQGELCNDGCYQFIGSVVNGEFYVSKTVRGIMDTQSPSVQIVAWLEKKENGDCVLQAEYLIEEEHVKLLKSDLQEIVSGRLLDGQILENNHGKLSFPIREEEDGVYEWTVIAEDWAGNKGFATSSVKSGAYTSGDVWSMQKPGKEELKADGVQAELFDPLDGAEINTETVRVMGMANATGEIQYMLRLWDISGQLLPCMAEEREAGWLLKYYQNAKDDENLTYKIPRRQMAVTEGLLGILDISGLENGRYRLELVVMGVNGTANSLRDNACCLQALQ